MDAKIVDQKLKDKLEELKQQKRQDEVLGLISMVGEMVVESIQKAISEIKIVVPDIDTPEIPEIVVPKIEMPDFPSFPEITIPEIKIPEITVPEIKIPDFPEINTDGIREAIQESFSKLTFPEPRVEVNIPEMKMPKMPEIEQLPPYDNGSVKYTLEPIGEVWTLRKGKKVVAKVTLTYFDKDMNELASFNIEKNV